MANLRLNAWIEAQMSRLPADFGRTSPAIHYWVGIPVVVFQVGWVIYHRELSLLAGAAYWALGLLLWSISEYVIHRFSFHSTSQHPLMRPFTSGLHRLHHETPNSDAYVAAPIILAVPVYAIALAMFRLAIGDMSIALMLGTGYLLGFLAYEYVHYATHLSPAKTSAMKYLKKHHMTHHFVDKTAFFGVTSPLWDVVFGTLKSNSDRQRRSA